MMFIEFWGCINQLTDNSIKQSTFASSNISYYAYKLALFYGYTHIFQGQKVFKRLLHTIEEAFLVCILDLRSFFFATFCTGLFLLGLLAPVEVCPWRDCDGG